MLLIILFIYTFDDGMSGNDSHCSWAISSVRFTRDTSRSRTAERRLALRQTLGAEVSAQCKLKVRSKSDELEAHSDPETAELSRQTSAGDASQPP